jgi:hypothetical protein
LLYNYMLDKKEPQWEVEWRNEEELQQSRQWSIQVEINKNNLEVKIAIFFMLLYTHSIHGLVLTNRHFWCILGSKLL